MDQKQRKNQYGTLQPPKMTPKTTPNTSHFNHRPKREKKIPRAANTSLEKIFRLVLIENDSRGLKKIYEEYRYSGKAPTGRYTVL